jgi:hypothetical protein
MIAQPFNVKRMHPVRALAGMFAIVAMLCLAAGQAHAQRVEGTCMLVVRAADLSNGFDSAINDRLVSLGFTVTIVEGGAFDTVAAGTLNTYALCVVSESISSGNVDEILGADVPLMHNEPYGWDNVGYAGPGSGGTWFSDSSNSMDIQSVSHPVLTEAGASAGSFVLYNQITNFARTDRTMIGKEANQFGAGAQILALGSGAQSTFAVMWAYDQGATMQTGTAANRIFAMCLPGDEAGANIPAADVRDEYWAIFDAAVHWLDPTSVQEEDPFVAHWPCDDGSGSTVTEIINGLDGALIDDDVTTSWNAQGRVDGSLVFDGSSRVEVANNDLIDVTTGSFSIAFWLLQDGPLPSGTENRYFIKGTIPGATGIRMECFNKDNRFRFAIDDGATKPEQQVDGTSFTLNQWAHAVVVCDRDEPSTGTGHLRIYLNGVEQATIGGSPDFAQSSVGSISNPAQPLEFGGHGVDTNIPLWVGEMDDIRFYRRALSAQDVEDLYDSFPSEGVNAVNRWTFY